MKCGSWRCGEGRPGLEHVLVWRSVVFEASPSRGGHVRWELPAGSQAGARRILILYPCLCPRLLPVPPTLPRVPPSLCLQPWDAAHGDLRWDWHCLCRDVYNTLYIFVYKRKETKKKELLFSWSSFAQRGGAGREGRLQQGWEHACCTGPGAGGLLLCLQTLHRACGLSVCPARLRVHPNAKCGWGAASGGVGVGVAGITPAAGCVVLSRAPTARPRLSPHLGTKILAPRRAGLEETPQSCLEGCQG